MGRNNEALAELQAGGKFNEVAAKYSEDKARSGGEFLHFLSPLPLTTNAYFRGPRWI